MKVEKRCKNCMQEKNYIKLTQEVLNMQNEMVKITCNDCYNDALYFCVACSYYFDHQEIPNIFFHINTEDAEDHEIPAGLYRVKRYPWINNLSTPYFTIYSENVEKIADSIHDTCSGLVCPECCNELIKKIKETNFE